MNGLVSSARTPTLSYRYVMAFDPRIVRNRCFEQFNLQQLLPAFSACCAKREGLSLTNFVVWWPQRAIVQIRLEPPVLSGHSLKVNLHLMADFRHVVAFDDEDACFEPAPSSLRGKVCNFNVILYQDVEKCVYTINAPIFCAIDLYFYPPAGLAAASAFFVPELVRGCSCFCPAP